MMTLTRKSVALLLVVVVVMLIIIKVHGLTLYRFDSLIRISP